MRGSCNQQLNERYMIERFKALDITEGGISMEEYTRRGIDRLFFFPFLFLVRRKSVLQFPRDNSSENEIS